MVILSVSLGAYIAVSSALISLTEHEQAALKLGSTDLMFTNDSPFVFSLTGLPRACKIIGTRPLQTY